MTEQVAEQVPTTMSNMVGRLRDAASEVDLERIRDTASSAWDTTSSAMESASSALGSVDLDAGRKVLKKRAKQARKTAKTASKSAKAAREAALAAGKAAKMQAKDKGKSTLRGKPTLRERVFGWPLYSVAVAGAALGSLKWWRARQQASQTASAPPPSEISVVDRPEAQPQAQAEKRRSTG